MKGIFFFSDTMKMLVPYKIGILFCLFILLFISVLFITHVLHTDIGYIKNVCLSLLTFRVTIYKPHKNTKSLNLQNIKAIAYLQKILAFFKLSLTNKNIYWKARTCGISRLLNPPFFYSFILSNFL